MNGIRTDPTLALCGTGLEVVKISQAFFDDFPVRLRSIRLIFEPGKHGAEFLLVVTAEVLNLDACSEPFDERVEVGRDSPCSYFYGNRCDLAVPNF